jgi:hypothetical protein
MDSFTIFVIIAGVYHGAIASYNGVEANVLITGFMTPVLGILNSLALKSYCGIGLNLFILVNDLYALFNSSDDIRLKDLDRKIVLGLNVE